eukprot:CAMPEP_0176395464 /NCGR_PEP_ID=MMETSP0126-20121128/43429_1 /TAXON_ID=141414 ORGANISM="Strombidinopsis acuminatum, Strain SPMC142" /NCGR_SAMPLE_ID=MMETSP0126 /ASSEMBLY_ACC=CAM_ASM_000229 /LENGTH=45 /DNA_ID= /DNA_START= /DNA_END= /DNA_ORIENTATION=
MSPFAINAGKQGIPRRGGKHDDTTVIVSQIKFVYGQDGDQIEKEE